MRISLFLLIAWLLASALFGWVFSGTVHGETVQAGQTYYGVTYTQPISIAGNGLTTFNGCTFTLSSGVMLAVGQYQSVWCQNCTFQGGNPNQYGAQGATGIQASGALKLFVSTCTFNGLKVEILSDCQWGYCDTWIAWNTFEHANVRYSNGAGGWLNQSGWGTGVCLMHYRGYNSKPGEPVWHTIITNNTFTNTLGVDEPSDSINLYESSGVIVSSNQISGAKGFYGRYAMNAEGIVTDDEWADNPARRGQPGEANWTTHDCTIQNNILNNAAIGLYAGCNNTVTGNTIQNSARMATGQWNPLPFPGIGRYNPEGDEWANSNVVTGNKVSSVTVGGGAYNYINQAGPANWSANAEF